MATINKANNTTNLDTGSSWTGGTAPSTGDIAQWEATVTAANTTVLGSNRGWAGIIIANPGGLVTINAGNTLSIGSSGIVMSSATQDLTINCLVALSSGVIANIVSGVSLTLAGVISGANSLTKSGDGTLNLTAANSFSGALTIGGSELTFVNVSTIGNGGDNSSVGSSSNSAANLVIDGGSLYYIGAAFSTDRLLTITANGGHIFLEHSGTGTFNNTGSIVASGTGDRTLYLVGSGNLFEFYPIIVNPSSGVTSVTLYENGTRQLFANNTFTGALSFGSTLIVASLKDGGVASPLGKSTNAAANLIFSYNCTLRYVGSGDSTNRLFSILTDQYNTAGQYINNNGTGAINFTNTGAITFEADTGQATLAWHLGGTYVGTNTFSPVLSNYSGTRLISLEKLGATNWQLNAVNTYTGVTTVTAGALIVNGSLAAGSAVTVASGATISGTGTINGTLTCSSGAKIRPTLSGVNGGTLTLSNATSPSFTATTLTIRTPTSTVDKITLSNASASFTATNIALVVDCSGLSTSLTDVIIVSTANASGISGTFSSVTATKGYKATATYNAASITLNIVPIDMFAFNGQTNSKDVFWSTSS